MWKVVDSLSWLEGKRQPWGLFEIKLPMQPDSPSLTDEKMDATDL